MDNVPKKTLKFCLQNSFVILPNNIKFTTTVNSLMGDHPWGTTMWSLTGGGRYERVDCTLSTKILQRKTEQVPAI